MRARDEHDSFRHAPDTRDLDTARERKFRARENRLVKLGQDGLALVGPLGPRRKIVFL